MLELESASKMMERNVLTQPLSTAGPMLVTASWARLLRLPAKEAQIAVASFERSLWGDYASSAGENKKLGQTEVSPKK